MKEYSVKQLAQMAGISVRTLHHYDEIGLLEPAHRTRAGYRKYGGEELSRLQQILFYRELDFPLKEIAEILDSPEFDAVEALRRHKAALLSRRKRLTQLISTIDKTIAKETEGAPMSHEELYKGIPKEKAQAWRKEAKDKWGSAVDRSEEYLKSLGKQEFDELKAGFAQCWQTLVDMSDGDPESAEVQAEVEKHYHYIRRFWGTAGSPDDQAQQYVGLGELYKADSRYTTIEGKAYPKFGEFMSRAMRYFAKQNLD